MANSDITWEQWRLKLRADDDSEVWRCFVKARSGAARPGTTNAWRKDDRTRLFGDLGLHYLYWNHVAHDAVPDEAEAGKGGISDDHEELVVFRFPGGGALAKHAQKFAPAESLRLTDQAWKETWEHVSNYRQDVLRYLFRPSIYIRHIRQTREDLLVQVEDERPSLGDLLSSAADWESRSISQNPLVALQTFMQAALPGSSSVRVLVRNLELPALAEWARTYEALFVRYGVNVRPHRTWLDVAHLFSTMAEGAVLRTRTFDEEPVLSNGQGVLSAGVIAMLPSLTTVHEDELFTRVPLDTEGPKR